MKTYFGFKRVITDKETGLQKTEMRFVPVDIPELKAEDGWKLVGSSDIVEVVPVTSGTPITVNGPSILSGEQLCIAALDQTPETKKLPVGSSFESPVSGTAKLVRLKSQIKITYRRGKKTLNVTSPNSVCISELSKNQFFADCRRAFGKNCEDFRFSDMDPEYTYWNKFIDDEYARQLKVFNDNLK